MSDDLSEQKRSGDREKTVVVTIAAIVGVILILVIAAVIVLALLGPAIGNIYSNVEMMGLILLR